MCSSDEYKVFNAVTLTTSYETDTATKAVSIPIEVRSNDKFTLLPIYTKGSAETGNVCELEISFSPDGTNYSVYGAWADGGSGQLTYTPYYFNCAQDVLQNISIESLGRWMRIRAKEEGVASNAGTLTLYLYRNKN